METISTQAETQFVSTAQKLRIDGIEEGKKKTALRLIIKGYSNSIIMDATNLSENEIEKIRELNQLKLE
jgi:hypothetical protein